MKPLDTYHFPLHGASLIEASAGTGKTYTIVNLYLRILLAHQTHLNSPQGAALSVENILVVTFTNAATAELKERIRTRIQTAYFGFFEGKSDDLFIQQLIDDTDDLQRACDVLALASKQMDEAAIFTIHSFCQKILAEHAFESGSVFEENLQLDQSQWIKQATQDYWRRAVVTLDDNVLREVTDIWKTPEALEQNLVGLLHRDVEPLASNSLEAAALEVTQLRQLTAQMKLWWQQHRVSEQLQKAKLKANTKLGKPAIYAQMNQFVLGDEFACPFENGWQDWFPAKVNGARKAASDDLSHLDFSLFETLESQRLTCRRSIQTAILTDALLQVRINLEAFKIRTSQLSPDDLLSRLRLAIKSGSGHKLSHIIQKQFPAAMIDEFQDTDKVQFDIFSAIYPLSSLNVRDYCLVLIGDPKQAIYGFRGADIFTYIHAKRLILEDRHYTLAKNWRTQSRLVDCVNQLFGQSESGFLYERDIPFYPVEAAKPPTKLMINGQISASLNFYHAVADKGVLPAKDAKNQLARQATHVIVDMLTHGKLIKTAEQTHSINAGDICILVRTRSEAQIMKQALASSNVDSVFLIRQSVFSSESALDTYRLLVALANPKNESKVRAALLGTTFGLSGEKLNALFNDELAWQQLMEYFVDWHQQWQKHGLMMALNQVMQHFAVFSQLLKQHHDGLRRLTDLRHVIELLQHQSDTTPGQSQLVYWMWEQICEPDHNSESQQLRLETDSGLVQIITMHAAKGLEFPFVFIPFGSVYRETASAIFHGEDDRLRVDFNNATEYLQQADKERLAEDIRLLYVALTRAVHYCFVGVWNPALGRSKSESALALCALGRLLLASDQAANESSLRQALTALSNTCDAAVLEVDLPLQPRQLEIVNASQQEAFEHQNLNVDIDKQWRITSYSAIARNQMELEHDKSGFDESLVSGDESHEISLLEQPENDDVVMDQFSFPRGAQPGSFLHGVLENIEFSEPEAMANVIEQQGKWFGIDEVWYPVVHAWLTDVLATPISLPSGEGTRAFTLNALTRSQMCVEMEFHLPLNNVNVEAFSRLVNRIFKTTQRKYDFDQLHGMLKGFIDLTFCVGEQFFVADYKSNHLGDNSEQYSSENMSLAMRDHDYHLQSLLYVLALHRFLKVRLSNYDYDRHIGGAYYWFLRGMSARKPGHGVVLLKPEKHQIEQLDQLFAGQLPVNSNANNQPKEQLGLW